MIEFVVSLSLSLLICALLLFGIYYGFQRQILAYEQYQALLCVHMTENVKNCKLEFLTRIQSRMPAIAKVRVNFYSRKNLNFEAVSSQAYLEFVKPHPLLPRLQIHKKEDVKIETYYRKFL